MPIFAWGCKGCGKEYETVMSYSRSESVEILCRGCNVVMNKKVNIPAFTPSGWGDQTGTYGVNGKYNKGLGCYVKNDKDAERIAKSRGLVPFSEAFPGRSWENMTDAGMHDQMDDALKHEADAVAVRDKIAAGADAGEAYAEVFSVQRLKADGLLDDSVKG